MVHAFHRDLAPLVLEGVSDAALFVDELSARVVSVYTLEDVPDIAMSLRRLLQTIL